MQMTPGGQADHEGPRLPPRAPQSRRGPAPPPAPPRPPHSNGCPHPRLRRREPGPALPPSTHSTAPKLGLSRRFWRIFGQKSPRAADRGGLATPVSSSAGGPMCLVPPRTGAPTGETPPSRSGVAVVVGGGAQRAVAPEESLRAPGTPREDPRRAWNKTHRSTLNCSLVSVPFFSLHSSSPFLPLALSCLP